MRKLVIVSLLLLLLAGLSNAFAASQPIKLSDASNGITLLQSDPEGVTMKVSIGSLEAVPVSTKAGSFTLLVAPGLDNSSNIGEPSLPVADQLLAIPLGCDLSAELLSGETQEVSLTSLGITAPLMPAQPSLSKSENPDDVPFIYKSEVYLRAGYYQLPVTTTEVSGIMRGLRIGWISVAPVQYNASENRIRVYTEMMVRINFANPDWAATYDLYQKAYSPTFEPAYGMMANYNASAFGLRDDLTRYPMTLVIVSDRMFEAQLQPFIAWKVKKGFKVIIGYTDVVGTSTTAIKSYLQGLYNTETPKPSFVLLVGDVAQIPTFSGSAGSHVTDLRYCEFTGDNLPEIYYGRFSASTTALLQPQIDKTLEYEQYTMPNPAYLAHCSLVSGVDGTYAETHGNGQINYGTNLYFNAAHGIVPHVWLYPASDDPGAAAAIIAQFNQGVGFSNYTAHCSHEGWGDPSFTVSDVNNLTNAHKYGLTVGNCCLSNTFAESTPCFGEAWLQQANKGGIGAIGGTNSTYWNEDYWWGVGFKTVVPSGPPYDATKLGAYDGVFHDHGEPTTQHYITNDAINVCGNLAVEMSTSTRKTYYWEIYCLIGDPSVMAYMWQPTANSVSHMQSMLMTATSFTVQADAGSYVGISVNGVLYGAALVGPSGSVDVPLLPFSQPCVADLVVTAQNKIPYSTTVQVIAPSGPYVIYTGNTVNDAAGNNNGLVDFGENITLGVQLKNVGPDTAYNVVATLSTSDSYITITDATQDYGTIPGDNGTANIADAFAFTVDPATPDGHYINFTLTVTGSARDTWVSTFKIQTHAPAVSYLSVTVNDAAGNNNGKFDPGETVSLVVTLKNTGTGTAYNVTASMSELDNYVDLPDPNGTFGTISGSGGEANNAADVFVAHADSTCPMGHGLLAKLTIVGDGGYITSSNFNLTIGDRAVFFLEDFTIEQGWEGLGSASQWQIGPAIGGSSTSGNPDPSDDHTPGPDNFILGNNLGNPGSYAASIPSTNWVLSPIIDCGNASGVIMTYYHQLGVESSSYDHAYLEVFDGTDWINLYSSGATTNESGWQESVYDLSLTADNNPLFQIRFGFGPTDGSVQYCGWNIDDIELKGYISSSGGAAAVQLTPSEISDSLVEGTNVVRDLKVNNVGQANLRVRFVPVDSWIECSSQLNVIPIGDSLIVPVTLKTTGMAPGNHTGAINYTSNDPAHTTGTIPVTVYIHAPQIAVAPLSVAVYVDSGAQASKPLVIDNPGPGRLSYTVTCETGSKVFTPSPVPEPLGYRLGDPDKTGFREPYYAEVTKGSGGPDAFGYVWKDSDEPGGPTFNWIEIEGTGTDFTSLLGDDSFAGPFPIGFDFPFYDSVHSQFWVGSNGIVGLGPTTDLSALSNTAFPNAATPNGIIAWCWDDMNINDPDSPGGKALYQVVGGELVIEFKNYPEYDGTVNPGDVITAEIILSPNGKIRIQYLTIAPGFDILSCTVGLENATGTVGLPVVYNAAYLHDNLTILFKSPLSSWLSAEPVGGYVDPGAKDTVQVEFNAEDCIDSNYTGTVVINSNAPATPTVEIPVVMKVGQSLLIGDANADDMIDVSDAVYLIAYIFTSGPAPDPLESGDVDCSGLIDISDCVYLIAYIFASGPAPCTP